MIYLESHGNNVTKTAKEFGVHEKSIRDWREQKEKIFATEHKRDTYVVHNKPIEGWFPTMEKAVVEWIMQQRAENKAIDGRAIKNKAIIEYEKLPDSEKTNPNKQSKNNNG